MLQNAKSSVSKAFLKLKKKRIHIGKTNLQYSSE
jgi:hypothetical protein